MNALVWRDTLRYCALGVVAQDYTLVLGLAVGLKKLLGQELRLCARIRSTIRPDDLPAPEAGIELSVTKESN
jgi:hypothetical protein